MDSALGTRDMRELQRMMQLVTQLMKLAEENDLRLPGEEHQELLVAVNSVHAMLYPEQHRNG